MRHWAAALSGDDAPDLVHFLAKNVPFLPEPADFEGRLATKQLALGSTTKLAPIVTSLADVRS